ncbi:MAG: 30S ribosomal protein S6 [Spirochaetes bacterium RIFOXYC1_FULL_54_7]|nr:MAG: 30S ribosomal protein S6 [Spirochaetes bacterium RIFOXYC1_FULL_54_7]
MRPYELVTIFPTEEDIYRPAKETVTAELKKQGAEIVREDEMGERQLAYMIKNHQRGRYVLHTINMAPDKLIMAEKVFKLNTGILKYLFVRLDD